MTDYDTLKMVEQEWRDRCDGVKREVDYWRERHDALLKMLTDQASRLANPPIKMATHRESFEAGKTMAFNQAAYTIGIDTADGVHSVMVCRIIPGRDTVLVASARLPEDDWK